MQHASCRIFCYFFQYIFPPLQFPNPIYLVAGAASAASIGLPSVATAIGGSLPLSALLPAMPVLVPVGVGAVVTISVVRAFIG